MWNSSPAWQYKDIKFFGYSEKKLINFFLLALPHGSLVVGFVTTCTEDFAEYKLIKYVCM